MAGGILSNEGGKAGTPLCLFHASLATPTKATARFFRKENAAHCLGEREFVRRGERSLGSLNRRLLQMFPLAQTANDSPPACSKLPMLHPALLLVLRHATKIIEFATTRW